MRTLQPGSWNHLAAKFDLFGTSVNFGLPAKFAAHFTGSGAARGPARGKKRRHQKPPRFCPIQLEPLEQRQLLSGSSVTQDLFAATSGTPFNSSTNVGQQWYINNLNSGGNSYIANDALLVQQNVNNPYDVDLAKVTTNLTQNSVEQVTFNAGDDGANGPPGSNSAFGLVARANSSGLAYYGAQVEIVNENISGGDNAELYLYYSTNNNVNIIPSSTVYFSASLGTNYDLKFEVDTNPGNSSSTDLFASVWKQSSAEPSWMVTTTDSTAAFNGSGTHSTGYDGIFVNPREGGGETSTLSNYIESNNPGDLPLINNFTASPISYTGTGSQTFVFNAATPSVPPNDSYSYSLNFGDGVTSTYSAITNISHTYTSAPGSAYNYVYTPVLTISDSNSNNVPTISSSSQSISVYVNSAVPTPPSGTITVNRRGGNGISNSDPLIVQFTSSGSAYSSADPLTEYIVNFGDGDVSSYPIPSGGVTSTISFDTAHDYTQQNTYYPTLTLVDSDGATTVINAPSILITNSKNPPTVSISYNTTNSNLTATFSEDVGAALADFVNSSDTALGEPLWSDGASTANTAGSINSTNLGAPFYLPGSIAGALDVRNDESGANLTIPSTAYSYNNSSNTATWNLSTLVNNTSTSYTARLFADDIQDAAGNDLDGMGVGTGGDDATLHFGYTGYSAPTLTLASWNSAANATLWNSSMPFVFAPSIAPDSIKSLSAVTVAGNPSTLITFANTAATKLALEPILADINAVETEDTVDPPVIIEDITNPNFIALDGDTADIEAVTATNSTDSITINVKPYGQSILSTWSANASGSVHFSPYSGEIDGSEDDANLEAEFLTDLKKITGTAVNFGNNTTTPVNVTGNEVSNGIYIGEASQFDSSSPYYSTENFSFNDEAELGQTGYIVNDVAKSGGGDDLFILGGGPSGENDAMDAFLQNLGVEKYGPQNNISGDGNNGDGYTGYVVSAGTSSITENNVWQVMPTLSNLSGSWDIRGVPSISFVENNDFGNGNSYGVGEAWNDFLDFNMGGGTPVAVVTQKGLGTWPTQNSLDNHPDWWASTGNTLSGGDTVTTFGVPYGTITDGDTFTITLTTSSSAQSITVTATSTNGDDTPSGIVSLLASAISTSSQSYFVSTAITVVSTYTADLWVNSAAEWVKTPVLEIYPAANDGRSYTPTATTSGSATFQENTTDFAGANNGELNFTNPDVINFVVNSYVAGWLNENPAPNSMLTLAGSDGGNYDQSASTKALLNSLSPYTDGAGDWWGYNANGVLVAADSESYWALVNAAAASVMVYNQAHPGENLTVGGLGYEAVTQFPSFPLEPNVYVEVAEGEYDHTPDSTDQLLKGFGQDGALTGVYRYWTVYTNAGGDGEPASGDASVSSVNTDWNMFNNDHLTGVGGESNSNYGPDGLGYYLSDVYTANATLDNSTGRQTVLGDFYNNAFGPAANDMESYYVLFNGNSANAGLASPPSQVTFNGNAYLSGGQAAVTSDQEALQEAYGFVDAADTALTTAYNSGNNTSFTTTQYAGDQARVDQVRMYLHYLFLKYQFESDYFAYNIGGGYVDHHTAAFNAMVNDMTNETLWADSLAFTEGVDAQGYVDEFATTGEFGGLYNIYSNDPNGSYGLASPGSGLLQNPGNNNTTVLGGVTIYINNSPTQTMLNADWTQDEVALYGPTDLVANPGSPTSIDLSWTNIATQSGVDVGIERSSSNSFTPLTPIATVGAGVNTYVDNTVTNGTTYYYAVYAFNSTTASALSNTAKIATPNAAAGSVADDYWYGSNGSSWSSQWTLVNALSNGTAAATIQGDQGQVVFTKTSGTMSGGDNYLNESQTYEDSFQGVLFSMNTTTTTLLLTARTNSTAQNFYWARATTGASGDLLAIGKEVSGTSTNLVSFNVGAINTNTTYDLEFEVVTANTSTTDLYAKIWATTSTEPTTWTTYSTTDSTSALQGATGYDGLKFSGPTGTSDTYTVSDYESANITSSSASYIDDFQNSSTTGWSPSKSSDWSVGTNGDSIRYYINTTSYSGSGGALGLYSVLSSTSAFSNIGDFTMTVDVAVPSYSSSSNYAIVFGYQTSSSSYYFMEFSGTSGDTALYKDNNGTITQIAAASGTWITNANYSQIEIEHVGTAISVWDNGQSVLTAADSKFVNGDVGMGALNNTEAYFDNVIIGNANALSNGPSALSATAISSAEVGLSWTDNDGGKDAGYAIERSTNGTSYFQVATVADGATAYTDTSVVSGMLYYYEVESFLWFETSDFSNAATATPPLAAGVLAAPSNLVTNAVSSNEIDLSWVDNDNGAATGYDIDLSTNGTSFSQIATTGPSGVNTYSDTSLSEGTTYYFEVQAFNTTTSSNASAVSSATTYLNAPTDLSTDPVSTSEIDLSWTNNSALQTGFTIERSTTSTSGFTQIATVSSGTTSYHDTGLAEDGAEYYYEVQAFNGTTTSAFATANGVTFLAIPTSLSASESNGANNTQSITVSWHNNSATQTGFTIDRSTNGTSYSQYATLGGSSTTYTDTSVFPDNTYYYEVAAFNTLTNSANSTAVSAMTPSNEVGGVVTDYWYNPTNGSSWNSQWTLTNNLSNATAAVTVQGDQGQVKITRTSSPMLYSYLTNINTVTDQDSFQSVLVESNTANTSFQLVARAVSTSDTISYAAQLNFTTSGTTLEIIAKDSGSTVYGATSISIATNTLYDLEFEVVTVNASATDLYAKVWATSGTEPTTWQATGTDTTAGLQGLGAGGALGMKYFVTNAASNTFTVDNYEAVNLLSTNQSYIDNFENSSTTGWTAQLTTSSYWTTGVNGNSIRYYINSTSYAAPANGSLGALSLLTASSDTNVGDFNMTVDVAAASTASGSNYAIVFGYQTSGTLAGSYYFIDFSVNSSVTGLYKYNASTNTTTLIQAANAPATGTGNATYGGWIANTAYHAVKIQRSGTNISAWYDGQPLFTSAVSDSSFIGGEIGLGAINDSAYFDNVIVG